jgi:crotonobetainyl-CoA:carnitine CoA-transferase CaiB-like acyl-CoA transferase
VATLAALFSRQASGTGQHVDISKFEALAALQRVDISISRNRDESPDYRAPARLGGLVPCKDGYVVITVVEDHQWRYMVQMMGSPEWAADPRYADREQRSKLTGEIQPRLIKWAREHAKDEIYHLGQAAGCPVGPVQNIAELLDSPHLAAREFFATIDHPEAGRHRQPKMAFQLSESPWLAERPAPSLGQHNEEIYCTRLGRRPEEIAGLREAGII